MQMQCLIGGRAASGGHRLGTVRSGSSGGGGGSSAGRRSVAAAAGGRTTRRTAAPAIQELDLAKLYSDASYVPDRLIGPVEVQLPPGKTRRVVTRRDVPMGSLLFVSEPVGSVLRGEAGRMLLPPDLEAHLAAQQLGDSDRYKLAVLYDGSPASQQRQTSFKDFESATATTKAAKSKAKGFGAPAAPAATAAAAAAPQQRVSVELSADQLESVVSYNAFGSEVNDIGAAPARGEELTSFIGIWPEFALLNHSCVPNATATVIADRLVVRAASTLPKGSQVTVSYLETKGGVPLADRRRALSVAYGFKCGCPRCKLEEKAPEALQRHLEALHAAALPDGPGPFADLARAADRGDAPALAAIVAAAQPGVEKLKALLDEAGIQEGTLDRAALSAAAAGYLLQHQRAKMAAAAARLDAAAGSSDSGSGSSSGGEGVEVSPVELLDLVEVLRVYQPGGVGVLTTACDALSYTASQHGEASTQAQGALQLFLKMLLIKYGEVAQRSVLERLVDAITRSAPRLAALGLDAGFLVAAKGEGEA